jgi:hypothetical protein
MRLQNSVLILKLFSPVPQWRFKINATNPINIWMLKLFFFHAQFVITPTFFDLRVLSVSGWYSVCVMFELSLAFCFRSDWTTVESCFDSRWGKTFLYRKTSRLSAGPAQLAVQWVQEAVSLEVKRPGCGVDCLPLFADVIVRLYLLLCHAVAQLVEEQRYKPERCGFDSRFCYWNFSLTVLPVTLWPWSSLSL